MAFNTNNTTTHTLNGRRPEVVDDFKYLGASLSSTAKDIKSRKAPTWLALHKMNRV